jgi:hypothetical protein
MIIAKPGPGNNAAQAKATDIANDFYGGITLALHTAGGIVNTETARLIKTGPKTGRIYMYRGRPHQASAPGEAPASRSGRLIGSQDYKVRSVHQLIVGETAKSDKGAPYPDYLEYGTTKMAPRPHLITAVRNTARDVLSELGQRVMIMVT